MKKGSTEFKKPYSREIFGAESTAHYAYPKEALVAEEIFPYLVLDSGASQLAHDRFGGIHGDRLLELTMSGELFREFTYKGEFNWESSFAYTHGTDLTPKYEWQIWPQRLYMTIPVAHAFLRTGDRKYADAWLKIVKGWDEAHPYQPFDPDIYYLDTDMTWRDMQVAWRTMSLLHGLFMLQDAPFTIDEWKYLYDFVLLHAKHLYIEALDRLERRHVQNHVLQIGVVLIMAGVMFPEYENARDIVDIGIDTVRMNLSGIYSDGGSNEDSPSYSHFIVRLYLEAYLLLRNNGLEIPDGLYESICRQYEWVYGMSAPDGKVIPFSDSYSIDTLADIERARALIPLELPRERGSRLFAESKAAVIRCGELSLYVDAMDFIPNGHQHTGRPQTVLYYGTSPVLVDSGCSSYDRWELYLYLRKMSQHNVLYCPDIPDGEYSINTEITEFDPSEARIVLRSQVKGGGKEYEWVRSIKIKGQTVEICDTGSSKEPIRWESRLFLAQGDTKFYGREDARLKRLGEDYLMTLASDRPFDTELMPVMNAKNRIDYAVVTRICDTGSHFESKITLEFEKR